MQLILRHSARILLPALLLLALEAPTLAQPSAANLLVASNESSGPAASSGGGTGTILGTVSDVYGDILPGAQVELEDLSSKTARTSLAGDNGSFKFTGIEANGSYRVKVSAPGFADWESSDLSVSPGQFLIVPEIALKIAGEAVSVTVRGDTEQIAVEQVHLEEQQRVFGFIPNIYVVYDAADAVPLTPKLKFHMAMKVSVNPVTIGGVALMAGINQAANNPNFQEGARGYGQRFGAVAADGVSDIFIGGAILPVLLHQDPRYFYQGTGTKRSRLAHAALSPFICRGDNGRNQFNYSSIGGDLMSAGLSTAYYPESNRTYGFVFGNFAIGTTERVVSAIAQEFILPKFTSRGHKN